MDNNDYMFTSKGPPTHLLAWEIIKQVIKRCCTGPTILAAISRLYGMSTECVNQIIVSCDGQLPDCAGVLTHAFNQYLESYFYS